MKAYILTGPEPDAGTAPRVELHTDHIAIVDTDGRSIRVESRAAARHLAYLLCLAEDAANPEQFAVLAPPAAEPAAHMSSPRRWRQTDDQPDIDGIIKELRIRAVDDGAFEHQVIRALDSLRVMHRSLIKLRDRLREGDTEDMAVADQLDEVIAPESPEGGWIESAMQEVDRAVEAAIARAFDPGSLMPRPGDPACRRCGARLMFSARSRAEEKGSRP